MARGKLFEYAVLFHPKEKKDAAGNPIDEKKSIVVQDVTRVLATTDKEVAMLAAKSKVGRWADLARSTSKVAISRASWAI